MICLYHIPSKKLGRGGLEKPCATQENTIAGVSSFDTTALVAACNPAATQPSESEVSQQGRLLFAC